MMLWENKINKLLYKIDGNFVFCSRDGKEWRRSSFTVERFIIAIKSGVNFLENSFTLENE